jgi:hypothetical protein
MTDAAAAPPTSQPDAKAPSPSLAPLAVLLVLPAIAYAVGYFSLPKPAAVQKARATVDRKAFEGEVLLKETPTPAVTVNANFNNQITVIGLDVKPAAASIGERVAMTFYYRCEAEMQDAWRVFLHVDAQGAQYRIHGDHDPPKGFSTDKWRKGDVIADRHTQWIPLDAPKGTYDVWMGFYDPAHEDDRLPLVAGQQGVTSDGANRIKLGTLTVQ